MPPKPIDKRAFLTSIDCMTKGWYQRHGGNGDDDGKLSASDQLRIDEGIELHRRWRELEPEASFGGSVQKTQALVLDRRCRVIHEAAFSVGGFAARADAIRRVRGGWALVEVKSSLHDDDQVKDEHVDDMAFTAMVLKNSGLSVKAAELVRLNRDWRLGMPDSDLFRTINAAELVMPRVDEFMRHAEIARPALRRQLRPSARWCWACRNCDYFSSDCVGVGVRNPIFELPRLREAKFNALSALGVLTVDGIPADYRLSDHQLAYREAVRTRRPVVDAAFIRAELDQLRYPLGYLDYETILTAIPLFDGVAPHEQVLTQYSLHLQGAPDAELYHVDYLADHRRDCRRELAERLINDLEGVGSIVVYSPFERTQTRALARLFPDLADQLADIDTRLFDLLPVVRRGLVHPAFGGSYGIKVVLAVVAPDLSYEGGAIKDGGDAVAAFVLLAKGETGPGEVKAVRRDLTAYCRLDTLALVRLYEYLYGVGATT